MHQHNLFSKIRPIYTAAAAAVYCKNSYTAFGQADADRAICHIIPTLII